MDPGGKIVMKFGMVKGGAQVAGPEMMVNASRLNALQFLGEFSQSEGLLPGGNGDQGTILDYEGSRMTELFLCHSSSRKRRASSTPSRR